MSDIGSPEWRARNRAWLQSYTEPVDAAAREYIQKPLNKLIPGKWGDNLTGLLNFAPELGTGADVRDMRDGSRQTMKGLLAGKKYDALQGLGLMGIGVAGMIPGMDMAKPAAKEALTHIKPKDLDAMGFFSPTQRLVDKLPEKGVGQDFHNILKKGDGQGARIAEEMDDMGLSDWLQSKGKVSRDEVLEYVQNNRLRYDEKTLGWNGREKNIAAQQRYGMNWQDLSGVQGQRIIDETPSLDLPKPKYQEYAQKGGTDYQENLLKIPDETGKAKWDAMNAKEKSMRESGLEGTPEWEDLQAQIERANDFDNTARNRRYTPPHYDGEPNLALTTRTQSFNTPEGKSVHLMDELQSDWHSAGREAGYKNGSKPQISEYNPDDFVISQSDTQYITKDIDGVERTVGKGTVDGEEGARAYFSRWLGGLLDEKSVALENAYNRRAPNAPAKKSWMNQGIKSEITNTIESGKDYFAWTGGDIQARRYDLSNQVDGLRIDRIGDNKYEVWGQEKGTINYMRVDTDINGDDLHKYVGKDLSEKALKDIKDKPAASFTAEGVDLEVGGEGMKGFYDKDVRKRTEKIIKRLDPNAKVEVITLDNGNKVWGVKITDQMRGKVKSEGMSMYSVGGLLGAGAAATGAGLLSQQEQPKQQGLIY